MVYYIKRTGATAHTDKGLFNTTDRVKKKSEKKRNPSYIILVKLMMIKKMRTFSPIDINDDE